MAQFEVETRQTKEMFQGFRKYITALPAARLQVRITIQGEGDKESLLRDFFVG